MRSKLVSLGLFWTGIGMLVWLAAAEFSTIYVSVYDRACHQSPSEPVKTTLDIICTLNGQVNNLWEFGVLFYTGLSLVCIGSAISTRWHRKVIRGIVGSSRAT